MSVDVEDYFQVSAFDEVIPRSRWDDIPLRLPRNIDRVLSVFDEHDVRATFFTLGWVAERLPEMIRRIADEGHEIASHGYEHTRVTSLDPDSFRADVRKTKSLLEETSGVEVIGYRAPSFSIGRKSLWAHDILSEEGYAYSSSIFPINHDHYGVPDAPRFPFEAGPRGLLEIPMSSIAGFGRNWPCAGGGYFRLLPLAISKWATRRINVTDEMPTVFYFHPWELDPGQPKVAGIPAQTKFRHYLNLGRFESRLREMLRSFRWGTMKHVFLGRS